MTSEDGQATVEWTGLLLVVVVALGAAGAVMGLVAPGVGLARALRCAVLAGCRGEEGRLEVAYGAEVAGLVRAFAPGVDYEPRTLTLPVDFRSCRSHRCADAPDRRGVDVWRTARGRAATAFTHVVDRRGQGGDLFVQYWLYYPDSTWNAKLRLVGRLLPLSPLGWWSGKAAGFHRDDWESFQVRVTRGGDVFARASAHNGYAGAHHWPNLNELPVEAPIPTIADDAVGLGAPGGRHVAVSWRRRSDAWVPATGWTHVSRGSHAGFVPSGPGNDRRTESNGLRLVPIERLDARALATRFAIVPPWRKPVYADPERTDT
ncbi:MAG: hypothetical protein M3155_04545 [Actinomycetota bacterium]|nr:hypothetical protein [Actinomycetota bacterium]